MTLIREKYLKPSNLSLIRQLVSSDFKLRYQNSILGYLWSLLRPLLMFGVLYIVFTHIIRVGNTIPYYPSYLLLGLVMWTFFVESTASGLNAITGHGDMIRKVRIPKYLIVISTMLSAFVNFCLNMIVVFIFMFFGHVPFRLTILIAPIFILELMVFCLGISFLLSALYVKFRDLSHIWDVVLQVMFYAAPIIYPLSIIPKSLVKLASADPLAQIFQDVRYLMITPKTITTSEVFGSILGLLIPLGIVIIIGIVGVLYFRKSSPNFAEDL